VLESETIKLIWLVLMFKRFLQLSDPTERSPQNNVNFVYGFDLDRLSTSIISRVPQ